MSSGMFSIVIRCAPTRNLQGEGARTFLIAATLDDNSGDGRQGELQRSERRGTHLTRKACDGREWDFSLEDAWRNGERRSGER